MTAQAQLSRERLEEIAAHEIGAEDYPRRAEWQEMARMLLAAIDSKPVYFVEIEGDQDINAGRIEGKDRPDLGLLPDGINYLYAAPPAPVSMKDHQIRDLVNELRDVAVEYHGTQQMRERIARTVRAAMLQGAEPVTAATVPDGLIAGAKKLAELHGVSFVVFRNGEEPECADPSKVIISFTDAGLGYPAAVPEPAQERWQYKTVTGEWVDVLDAHGMALAEYEGCEVRRVPDEKDASLQLRNLIRQRHAEWSEKTFGNVGPAGPLKHLAKEAIEAADAPDDLSEWADMQFLLWDAQRRAGICDAEITAAMEDKLKVNIARQWPEPKDGEPRLHIKPEQEV